MRFFKYHTGLHEAGQLGPGVPEPPYLGRAWRADWEIATDTLHGGALQGDVWTPAREIILHAPSVYRAQFASDLILSANALLTGGDALGLRSIRVRPGTGAPVDNRPEEWWDSSFSSLGSSGLLAAAGLAAKVSHRRIHHYALSKFILSHEIYSTLPLDLDPSHWFHGPAVSRSPVIHTRCAYALLAGYSMIEELGLEARTSQEHPAYLGNGQWNPEVKEELDDRLRESRVDPDAVTVWTLRGTPTRIERRFQVRAVRRARWARGRVRDVLMPVRDAIVYAKRLRGGVAAHRFHGLTTALTPYDVVNVRDLGRQLLLSKLGFWRA